jgi:hypothetical protein
MHKLDKKILSKVKKLLGAANVVLIATDGKDHLTGTAEVKGNPKEVIAIVEAMDKIRGGLLAEAVQGAVKGLGDAVSQLQKNMKKNKK